MDSNRDNLNNEIKAECERFASKALVNLKELQSSYWDYSKELQDASFSSHWEQIEAISKLSQLGLAVHAAGEAYKAMNKARCN
jgi:cell division septum initiation protein DivIVA